MISFVVCVCSNLEYISSWLWSAFAKVSISVISLVVCVCSNLEYISSWLWSAFAKVSISVISFVVCVWSTKAYLSSWLCVFKDIVEGLIPFNVATVNSLGKVALSLNIVNCFPPFTLMKAYLPILSSPKPNTADSLSFPFLPNVK